MMLDALFSRISDINIRLLLEEEKRRKRTKKSSKN